jgi:hypothetical protein
MTWSDPIVDEVRRARDAYAASFDYDLRAIYHDLKEKEKHSGRKVVSYADRSPVLGPNQASQLGAPASTMADKLSSQK